MSDFSIIKYATKEDYSIKKPSETLYADGLKQAVDLANSLKVGVVYVGDKKVYANIEGRIVKNGDYFQFHHVGVLCKWFIRVTGELGVDCKGCILDGTSSDIYLRLKSGSSLCLNEKVNPNWFGSEFESEQVRNSIRRLIIQYCTFLQDVDLVLDKVVFSKTGGYNVYDLSTGTTGNLILEFN